VQSPDHRRRLAPLPSRDDRQGRVQDFVAGRGGVTDDDPARLARVSVTGQAHLAQQGEFDKVRPAQHDIDLGSRSAQPAAGIVGNQEQQILSQEHAITLPAPCPASGAAPAAPRRTNVTGRLASPGQRISPSSTGRAPRAREPEPRHHGTRTVSGSTWWREESVDDATGFAPSMLGSAIAVTSSGPHGARGDCH